MAWFGKKEEKNIQQLPDLPDLPELPQLPTLKSYTPLERYEPKAERLPSLPALKNPALEQKFTQSMIKDAVNAPVTREISDDESYVEETPWLNGSQKEYTEESETQQYTKEVSSRKSRVPKQFKQAAQVVRQKEPVFVRLDKFEQGLATFEEMKHKVTEIRETLQEIRAQKAKEEDELQHWEMQLQEMKAKVDKIDKEVFSRLP